MKFPFLLFLLLSLPLAAAPTSDQINLDIGTSISIVSHGHGEMVAELVDQLLICQSIGQVIITHNVPERVDLPPDPRISTIVNPAPKGFGANHNAAFRAVNHEWFVVLNPDVAIQGDPFEKMLNEAQVSGGSILAPCARTATGATDDNWRRFPTVWSLVLKAFGGSDGRYASGPLRRRLSAWNGSPVFAC